MISLGRDRQPDDEPEKELGDMLDRQRDVVTNHILNQQGQQARREIDQHMRRGKKAKTLNRKNKRRNKRRKK